VSTAAWTGGTHELDPLVRQTQGGKSIRSLRGSPLDEGHLSDHLLRSRDSSLPAPIALPSEAPRRRIGHISATKQIG